MECTEAGAHILNLSLMFAHPSSRGHLSLAQALDRAAQLGVIVVAAAGNHGVIGSSMITGHPWVIPVAACDAAGTPLDETNLGRSIGLRGLRAPGHRIVSFDTEGQPLTLSGTSFAAPFVTGAIALLWSQFPQAKGAQIHTAFMQAHARGRRTVTPPLLDAWAAYQGFVAR